MGTLYTRPYGFQIRIINKLLPKDLWATFDTREAAEQYMEQLEGLLAQGIVPNWEHVGVKPDIAVPAAQALQTAHVAILRNLVSSAKDDNERTKLQRLLAMVEKGEAEKPVSAGIADEGQGVGELGLCGVGAAVANAVYNATGVRVRDYPVTLDKLLAKMPALV
jgi:hypothetical protein